MAFPNGAEHGACVGGRVAGERPRRLNVHGHRLERRLVARKRNRVPVVGRVDVSERQLRVSVHAGYPDEAAPGRQRVPLGEHLRRRVDEGGDGRCWPEGIGKKRFDQAKPWLPTRFPQMHPPARVGIDDLDAVEGRGPLAPPQLGLGRVWMGGDAKAAHPANILDDVPWLTAQRIGRGRHVQDDVVTARRADFDPVQAQDASLIPRRIGLARGVPVVGEHEELQAGAGGARDDLVGRAPAIRSVGMYVQRAGECPVALPFSERDGLGRERRGDQDGNGGCEDRCHQDHAFLHRPTLNAERPKLGPTAGDLRDSVSKVAVPPVTTWRRREGRRPCRSVPR